MTKTVVIGITGGVGSRIATELLLRGHQVTGIARNLDGAAAREGLTLKEGDATSPQDLAPLLRGQDVVISATSFVGGSDSAALISAAKTASVPRLLVVGGSSNLEVAPGKTVTDTLDFPQTYRAEADASRLLLNGLRKEQDLDWTFFSPPSLFEPDGRTGRFRLGDDALLSDANGKSAISMEDYAIAMVDEIETPQHPRRQFTAAY